MYTLFIGLFFAIGVGRIAELSHRSTWAWSFLAFGIMLVLHMLGCGLFAPILGAAAGIGALLYADHKRDLRRS